MEQLLPWFLLKDVPGIGNRLYKRLIDRFESPASVFRAEPDALLGVGGMHPRTVSAVKSHRPSDRIYHELDRIAEKGYRIITLTHPLYPPLLLEIPDPPPFLYVSGDLGPTEQSVSVVGSRNATEYGRTVTRQLCQALAEMGLVIVSGMARGIDTAAHVGALAGYGRTIAVLGSGFDRIYPEENRDLFHRISKNGAVITEFYLATEPDPHNFPIRNRVISGMSLGTIVVEATRKSGSLITARLAAEQNREVFAVPGDIHSFKSIGTHSLIKQGAKLVEHAQDIIEELSPRLHPPPEPGERFDSPRKQGVSPALDRDESSILDILEPYPIHIDDLARKTGLGPGNVASILLRLELKGLVNQMPGKHFALTNRSD